MGKIFTLITQLRNLTQSWVGFEIVVGGRCSLTIPVLPPGKTRLVKLHRVLRYSREYGSPDWIIRVWVDDWFTGMELESSVLLNYVRIVFSDENGSGVLCVEGVPENCSDFLLRHKYFGCMRNIFWNDRPREAIDRSDSRLASDLEGDYRGHHLAPFADATLLKKRQSAPPTRKLADKNTMQTTKRTGNRPNYFVEVVPWEKPRMIFMEDTWGSFKYIVLFIFSFLLFLVDHKYIQELDL